jgi:hypothetical protein
MHLLVALAPWTLPSAALESSVYSWDWSRTHRFYLESHVQLPVVMWLATPYNHQARITAFDVRLVTTCANAQVLTKHTVEVNCSIDDVALSAAGLPQEAGLLQPILVELDEMLSGATVQLQMNDDGKLGNISLDGLKRRNNRSGWINENLRLIVSRAYAGLDLNLPQDEENSWPQYESWLMRAPAVDGSSGGTELVHREIAREGSFSTIVTGGRGVIVVGEGANKYDTRMVGETRFDLRTGRIADRVWTVVGGPTASSVIAFGAAGYPYLQQGRLVALTEAEPWDVGQSEELHEVASFPTAIQQSGPGSVLGGPIR